jgi:hypothetical protein
MEQKKQRLNYEDLIARTGQRISSVVPEPQNPQLHCAAFRRKELIPGLSPL